MYTYTIKYMHGNQYEYQIHNQQGVVVTRMATWPSEYMAEMQAKIRIRAIMKKNENKTTNGEIK